MGKPDAGSLDRVHPNAGVPVISHFFHDIVPYEDCCKLTDNCDKYFEKRPSDDGSQYQAPRPGIYNFYRFSIRYRNIDQSPSSFMIALFWCT